MNLRLRLPIVMTFVAGLSRLAPALAQTSAEAEATWRALVSDAQSAQTAGDHTRALDLAQRALHTHASPSLQRFIAEEQSALGQVVAALDSAHRCVDAASDGTHEADRASCATLADALSHRVGRIVINPPSPMPTGLHVRVSGSDLSLALLGVPYIVAPGDVLVDANAPGSQPFHQSVHVAPGETSSLALTLTLTMPAAPTGSAAATHPTLVARHRTTAPPSSPPSADTSSGFPYHPLPIAGFVSGGVLVVGGLVSYLVGNSAVSSFTNAGCLVNPATSVPAGGPNCTGWYSTGSTAGTLETVGFTVGGMALAAATAMWFLAPSTHESASHASILCLPVPGAAGLSCGGTF